MVKELGFGDPYPQVPVYCDNQSTIAVVANNGNTSRVRHMAKHARFINEYVDEKALEVLYVPSAENLAGVFTKALGPAEFERQRRGLNIEDVTKAWAEVEATAEPEMTCASGRSEDADIEMEEV
ncbi:hypothetical protein PR002_g32838 [Phytophthora rubi]|nr:hypothetical protein PR002_g32838 [Phytophthora rubi]